MRYIGDVHGLFDNYEKIISTCDKSIQVGDMGIGFPRKESDPVWKKNHRFIRGNHDNPQKCYEHPNFIADGTIEQETMFIGGAWSIDQSRRIEGVSWWRDEQLSYTDMMDCYDSYCETKPRVMITHDAPQSVPIHIFNWLQQEEAFANVTNQAFQAMFEYHQPELWIFGHWHERADVTINGTRFICLNELEYIDIDPNSLRTTEIFSYYNL